MGNCAQPQNNDEHHNQFQNMKDSDINNSDKLKNFDMLQSSGLQLEGVLYTKVPLKGWYSLNYKLQYGKVINQWGEVIIQLQATPQEDSQGKRSFYEDIQKNKLEVQVVFNLHDCLKAQKAVSPKKVISEQVFDASASFLNNKQLKNGQLGLKIYEEFGSSSKVVLDCKELAEFNDSSQIYKFPFVQFTSNVLSEGNVFKKILLIVIKEVFYEQNKKTKELVEKEKFHGQVQIKISEAMKYAKTDIQEYDIKNEKGKKQGTFFLKNMSIRNYSTFLDLLIKNGLNIVPVIGVDFSLANLTFDENQYCIHTLKQGAQNDYVDVLKRVVASFEKYSQFMLAYGYGARTVEGEGPACNLLSMTGDFQDPFVMNEEELLNSYIGTIKTVKLALPVYFKDIIKLVSDLAKVEFATASDIKQIKNYYVLVLLMAGVIDDFQDSLNEILRAAHLPVSVIIIKIGSSQEENDSSLIIQNAMQTFTECERKFINMLVYQHYKTDQPNLVPDQEQQFEFDLIKNIPQNIEKFYELQQFEVDVTSDSVKEEVFDKNGSMPSLGQSFSKTSDSTKVIESINKSETPEESLSHLKSPISSLQNTINLNEESKEQETEQTLKYGIFQDKNHDYVKNIKLLIETEKQQIISQAIEQGIDEERVTKYINEENISDYYIDNLKIRLGIKEEKPEKKRGKPVQQSS